MLFWEQTNPRFDTYHHSELTYIWEWLRPEGWILYDDQRTPGLILQSASLTIETLVEVVQQRVQPVPGITNIQDHLVAYCAVANDFWTVGLIAGPTGSFSIFNMEPPWWWPAEKAPLERMLDRVTKRLVYVREAARRREFPSTKFTITTHCSKCGLPAHKHISHEVPGVEKPPLYTSDNAQWDAYRRAFQKHYSSALMRLTDEEFLNMTIPDNIRHLGSLTVEVKRRIAHPTPEKNRYDRLLDEDHFKE